MFVKELCERFFVSRGMCVQFAIHDSENNKGQRNLHCHIMLTLRGLDKNGKWMPKQKKVYLTDENGERIPIIDKKTGVQKVDKQNRKQWKCTTVATNDWNSKENAKKWRKELVDAINAANSDLGMTQDIWEYRSFKEQGLDIIPQIHLGEKASAMERAGIHTIRGDINREIMARNAVINAARFAYEKAREELEAIKAVPVTVIKVFKSEIIDMIRKMTGRNKNRLTLPIIKGKYIGAVSDRASLQNKEKMEAYVQDKGWTTFAEMNEEKKSLEQLYDEVEVSKDKIRKRMDYLEMLLNANEKYEPYHQIYSEYWKLKKAEEKLGKGKVLGFGTKSKAEEYRRFHHAELNTHRVYREVFKGMIEESDKRITPKKWQEELESLKADYQKNRIRCSDITLHLAKIEVLSYNKRDLERMLENESHQKKHDIGRKRNMVEI
jgi:hypothetical protein